MSLYTLGDIDPQQAMLLKKHNGEVSREDLAININAIEDLAQLYTNLPASRLKQQVKKLLNEYTKQGNANSIDIPRTLVKFFTMRDQNQILQNIKLLEMIDHGGNAD